jgi:hypothetical protein
MTLEQIMRYHEREAQKARETREACQNSAATMFDADQADDIIADANSRITFHDAAADLLLLWINDDKLERQFVQSLD